MTDCTPEFNKFFSRIQLPLSNRKSLVTAVGALRERIRTYFTEELEFEPPLFWRQGSYAMNTIVNPLDGEYDIDDGIYLQNIGEVIEKWPTPETVHGWIKDAVQGHTDQAPVDKRTCVRVVYAGKYHVDLPIYGESKGTYYLAEKGEGWRPSDPRGFTNWFLDQVKGQSEQIRRIVSYLKAWADEQSEQLKMPSGMILTVLSAYYYAGNDREDIAFAATVAAIYQVLSRDFSVQNPVDSTEDLTKRLSTQQKKGFLEKLSVLRSDAARALNENAKKKATEIWRGQFGDRFPDSDDKGDTGHPLRTAAPALLKNDARSATGF